MTVNRVERLIINLDMAKPVTCAWDECDRPARTPYQVREHRHTSVHRCDDPWYGNHSTYAFCSERHLQYWVSSTGSRAHDLAARNQGRIYGQLPAGMKRMIG